MAPDTTWGPVRITSELHSHSRSRSRSRSLRLRLMLRENSEDSAALCRSREHSRNASSASTPTSRAGPSVGRSRRTHRTSEPVHGEALPGAGASVGRTRSATLRRPSPRRLRPLHGGAGADAPAQSAAGADEPAQQEGGAAWAGRYRAGCQEGVHRPVHRVLQRAAAAPAGTSEL